MSRCFFEVQRSKPSFLSLNNVDIGLEDAFRLKSNSKATNFFEKDKTRRRLVDGQKLSDTYRMKLTFHYEFFNGK